MVVPAVKFEKMLQDLWDWALHAEGCGTVHCMLNWEDCDVLGEDTRSMSYMGIIRDQMCRSC